MPADIGGPRGKSCARFAMPSIAGNIPASAPDVGVGPWSDDERVRRYDSDENGRFYGTLLTRLVAGAGPFVGGRGLDLGCGSGFATEGLVRAFPGVTWEGVDVSAPMLARAACKPAVTAISLPKLRENLTRVTWQSSTSDCTTCAVWSRLPSSTTTISQCGDICCSTPRIFCSVCAMFFSSL